MKPYVYKGTQRTVEDEAGEYTHDPLRCGTFEGYRKHKRNHETICPPCREAKRVRAAEDYAEKVAAREAVPFDTSACGTSAGYQRHKHHDVPPCDPCKAGRAEYMADYRAKRKAAKTPRPVGVFDPAVCGDNNGYHRHVRNGTPACAPCLAGHNTHQGTERRAA